MLQHQAERLNVPIIYCNSVGGNDQLVFDGHSLAISETGLMLHALRGFEEELAIASVNFKSQDVKASVADDSTLRDELEELYRALTLGVRDYFHKCGYMRAVIGLSGGIDSALTAVLAAEALGKEQVTGVAMPGPFSSAGSIQDALTLAENLDISCLMLPITPAFEVMRVGLAEVFVDKPEDATEENLQARLRGVTLMALSNKFGSLLLTTGNKSELAVGYCTLYGDMCGGLAVISDLPKTLVYELSRWVNRTKEIIPANTIDWYAALSPANVAKTMAAPVTALIAYDLDFIDTFPETFPQRDMRGVFAGKRAKVEAWVVRMTAPLRAPSQFRRHANQVIYEATEIVENA